MSKTLLEVKGLKKYFPIKKGLLKRTAGQVKAVDGVDLTLYQGETFGLVGESGCGKSTTGRLILRLLDATEGSIKFDGQQIEDIKGEELRNIRQGMQMVFQDPYASLNPKMTVEQAVVEPMDIYGIGTPEERKNRARELMQIVGLSDFYMNRYPHEFSGGQRQRIGIARALSLQPKLVVCDEPVSALDVSVRAQVLKLLQELQEEYGLTYLFISHDLSVVKHISHRVAVMYLGKIVELGNKDEIFDNPLHKYTQALMSAVPIPNPERKRNRIVLEGDVPSPANPPSGCVFHPRCSHRTDICKQQVPEFIEHSPGHWAACHKWND